MGRFPDPPIQCECLRLILKTVDGELVGQENGPLNLKLVLVKCLPIAEYVGILFHGAAIRAFNRDSKTGPGRTGGTLPGPA